MTQTGSFGGAQHRPNPSRTLATVKTKSAWRQHATANSEPKRLSHSITNIAHTRTDTAAMNPKFSEKETRTVPPRSANQSRNRADTSAKANAIRHEADRCRRPDGVPRRKPRCLSPEVPTRIEPEKFPQKRGNLAARSRQTSRVNRFIQEIAKKSVAEGSTAGHP